ncbi:MAG: ribosomal protein S18-alanine N-acetyltransferase [Veillonellales bacterium]
MEFHIRPMNQADIDGVLLVERQSFITPWSRKAFEAECENELAYYLLLLEGHQIIGYGGMWVIIDEAHVTNIAVSRGYRGLGLGRRLLLAMMADAKKRGAASMTLEVRTGNTVARKLYTSLNFKERGIRPGYYSDTHEDALIMWRDAL